MFALDVYQDLGSWCTADGDGSECLSHFSRPPLRFVFV